MQDWAKTLDWLAGKCTFCAGRGYGDAHIRHTLRRCQRGGASQVRRGIGEMFYDEGFLPSNGCDYCRLPRDFCSRWKKTDQGSWLRTSAGRCKYGAYLLSDGIIGFYTCGVQQYWFDVCEGVEGYCENEGEDNPPYDDEAAAAWLMQPLAVAGVEASEMVRQLSIWTKGLDAFTNWSKQEDHSTEM